MPPGFEAAEAGDLLLTRTPGQNTLIMSADGDFILRDLAVKIR